MKIYNLAFIPTKTQIFVDTNILVLGIQENGQFEQPCRDFIARITCKELEGFTSTGVVSELIHRFIVSEAKKLLGLTSQETVEYLQKNPDLVKQLKQHATVVSQIGRMKIDIRPIEVKDLHKSKEYRAKYGLMANDSLIAAFMENNGLRHLATHDNGFKRVKELKVWMPKVNKAR